MKDAEIIKALGGAQAVADALGLKRQRVTNWTLEGREIAGGYRAAVLRLAEQRGLLIDEEVFLRLPAGLTRAGPPNERAA